jgi:hypothetical protein
VLDGRQHAAMGRASLLITLSAVAYIRLDFLPAPFISTPVRCRFGAGSGFVRHFFMRYVDRSFTEKFGRKRLRANLRSLLGARNSTA